MDSRRHLNHVRSCLCLVPNSAEIVVYDANTKSISPASTGTQAQQAEACSKACLAKYPGTNGVFWEGFVARGFAVDTNNGNCFCEPFNAHTCERSSKAGYISYNFISNGK